MVASVDVRLGRRVYELAAMVERCAEDPFSFFELLTDTNVAVQCFGRSQRTTVLHYYTYTMICLVYNQRYRKDGDCYDEHEAEDWKAVARPYDIELDAYTETDSHWNPFYHWYERNGAKFDQLWGYMTDEVFSLLFANRRFLQRFNTSLSEYFDEEPSALSGIKLTAKGRIPRARYVPMWLRKAVFFREQGRCAICSQDLSGLLRTDHRVHYDHILPLAMGGTNDPVNFQMVCENCNLQKGAHDARTSFYYIPWWA